MKEWINGDICFLYMKQNHMGAVKCCDHLDVGYTRSYLQLGRVISSVYRTDTYCSLEFIQSEVVNLGNSYISMVVDEDNLEISVMLTKMLKSKDESLYVIWYGGDFVQSNRKLIEEINLIDLVVGEAASKTIAEYVVGNTIVTDIINPYESISVNHVEDVGIRIGQEYNHRQDSVIDIITSIDQKLDYGFYTVLINDNDLLAISGWKELLSTLKSRCNGITFTINAVLGNGLIDNIEELKKCGCINLNILIESIDDIKNYENLKRLQAHNDIGFHFEICSNINQIEAGHLKILIDSLKKLQLAGRKKI